MSNHRQGSIFVNRGRVRSAHGEFLDVTRDRYNAMQKRFGPKRHKVTGKLLRPGEPLPFTLDEFREWVITRLGGEQGVGRCEYCNAPIDIRSMDADHQTPRSQGGSLDLENLAVACNQCNQQKGGMSCRAFVILLKLINNCLTVDDISVENFNQVDRTDLLGRLERSMRLAIQLRKLERAAHSPVAEDWRHIRLSPVREPP
jgi:5-methylcytosine-specific restriction endonuclease McrA